MILGKRYSRLKRDVNAGSISVKLIGEDGREIKPHRKLNMLLVLSIQGKVNHKAVSREMKKFFKLTKL